MPQGHTGYRRSEGKASRAKAFIVVFFMGKNGGR